MLTVSDMPLFHTLRVTGKLDLRLWAVGWVVALQRGPWGLQQRAGEARGRAAGAAAAAAQVPPLLQSLPWPLPGTEGWVRRRGPAKEASSELRRRRGGGGGDSWRVALSDGIRNGCASGLAAACAKLLLQPFDTVKTVQQVGGEGGAGGAATESSEGRVCERAEEGERERDQGGS